MKDAKHSLLADLELLIRSKGLTTAEFSRQVGVSRRQAENLIAGRQRPRVDRALKIAQLLGVRVEDIWSV